MLPWIAAVVAAGALVWRSRHLRAIEELATRIRPLGPNGVVVGAEGFELERTGAPAILLLHGGGDTPQTLRYLGEFLFSRGFSVSAPLLPGHGRTLKSFARITPDELTDAARDHYATLRTRHDWVGVIGVSMGGALAVQLAATTPDLPALGLVAPYLAMPRHVARAARSAWLWGPAMPYVRSTSGGSILDPAERERNLGYVAFAAPALYTLYLVVQRAAAALPRVAAPTLVLQSRGDNRISAAAAEEAFARLGAREKRFEWISGAGHIITVDYGRQRVFEQLGEWMEAHGARIRELEQES